MRRLSLIAIMLAFSNLGFGQTGCPRVVVYGPAGIVSPGENITYTLSIVPPEKEVGLSYLWTVHSADGQVGMVRGQGTKQIEVPFSYNNTTATVEVIGLPEGCPNTASEVVGFTTHEKAFKVLTISGSIPKVSKSDVLTIRKAMAENPHSILFAYVSPGKGGSFRVKSDSLRSRLGLSPDGTKYQIILRESAKRNDQTTVWLVPFGAQYPVD